MANEKPRHPIQPLVTDEGGVVRFKANAIVRYLLDHGPFDLNDLALLGFDQEDREQFAQLIGYSLRGFEMLSYVRDETYRAAELLLDGDAQRDARIKALEEAIAAAREGVRAAAVALFKIHPDDLGF